MLTREEMKRALEVAKHRAIKWSRLGKSRECPEGIARVAHKDPVTYVWCGGTNTFREIIDNFRLKKEDFINSEIQVNSADLIQAQKILSAMPDVAHGTPVVVAGFSRGVAVGMVLAALLVTEKNAKVQFVGWSGKRTGNAAFVKWFADNIPYIHLSGIADVVPLVPPWPMYKATKIVWKFVSFHPWKAHLEGLKSAAYWRNRPNQEIFNITW